MAQFRGGPGVRVTKYFEGRPPPPKPWKRDPRPPEALRWLEAVRRDHETGRLTASSPLTVGEQIAEWMALRSPGLGPSTRRAYVSAIENTRPLWDMRLDALRANHVQAWLNQLLQSKAPKSVTQYRNVLNQAMKAAVEWERIPRNPVAHADIKAAKPVRERRAWSLDDANRFLKSTQDDPLYPMWMTLLRTGMRQGEVRGLRWGDIDFQRKTITVAGKLDDEGREWTPTDKTKKVRPLPLVARLEAALRDHRDAHFVFPQIVSVAKAKSDYVFTREDGRPLTGAYVRYHFGRACHQAGMVPLVPHEARHTAATLMADDGVPLPVLASIFGWATAKMLEDVYYHGSAEAQRQALEALSTRLSG